MSSPAVSPRAPSTPSGEVVAGLINTGLASAVAVAAVREAAARGARIRFLQVLPDGLSVEDRDEAASVLFKVALKSLHKTRQMPCTFETVVGTPAGTLVERSRGAALIVLGADRPGAEVRVVEYCQQHCSCDVMVVSQPLESQFVA